MLVHIVVVLPCHAKSNLQILQVIFCFTLSKVKCSQILDVLGRSRDKAELELDVVVYVAVVQGACADQYRSQCLHCVSWQQAAWSGQRLSPAACTLHKRRVISWR